ncbi:hypothetical protein V9T40_010219 [Parthenolecanium corni]|uniref:Uncharacterized protein n=1 Tax=Parthenolecanium corni TaxID=536013 RepID=A0AAN9TLG9_9HEMI
MKYSFVCLFFVAVWKVQHTHAVCWDTGCQLDSWAVRGCQQYGMLKTGQKSCPNGIIYSCCDQNQTSSPSLTSRPKCWDTGCQLDSWAIRGCQQYGMIETGQKTCPDGLIFSCCEDSHTSASPHRGRPKCWDTGCQLDSWAVRGCEQYGMLETGQKSCQGGIVYSCCESNTVGNNAISSKTKNSDNDISSATSDNSKSTTASHKAKPKCWETGCQLDSWLVRGCEQYDMVEVGEKWCDGGLVYSCCDKNATGLTSAPNSKPKCWDTGCQLDSWAVRGCQQYGMVETGQKTCPNGIIYSCCQTSSANSNSSGKESHSNTDTSGHTSNANDISNKISSNDHSSPPTTLTVKPKCWDTGCQQDSWQVRGCEQYDMIEVGQKWCDGGRIYSCCDKNATKPSAVAQPAKPKCWETGCQLDSWAVRGCEQYHMTEIGQRPCHQGLIYSCCEKNSTNAPVGGSTPIGSESTATPLVIIVTPSTPAAASKPKCWDTGCQLDSWAVRGCEQYGMVETGQKQCPNGIVYSCCENNSTVSSIQLKPKCWDTGCQLDSWAVRGCEQYGMVETGQKQCPNGIVYSCCENNSTVSSIQLKPKCWDTGCQLNSWAVRGCEQYSMMEVGQKSCPDGIVYSCCDKNVTTAPPPKVEHKCWETGCQLSSWAVRGCEQYDMEEVGQKECDNGIVYSCCQKNSTAPVVRQATKKCWETGCQLDVWKSRGCEQYSMIEKSQKACTNGIVFTCCRP